VSAAAVYHALPVQVAAGIAGGAAVAHASDTAAADVAEAAGAVTQHLYSTAELVSRGVCRLLPSSSDAAGDLSS
jgi:hypothetical protein